MTSEQLRDLLIRQWRLIAACAILGAIAATAGALLIGHSAPTYASTAVVQVDLNGSLTDVPGILATESWLASSTPLVTSVAAHYPGLTPEQLKSEISASAITGTRLLEVSVTDADPTRGAQLANDVAQALVTSNQQAIQQQSDAEQQDIQHTLTGVQSQIDQLTAELTQAQHSTGTDAHVADLQSQLNALRQQQALLEWSLVQARTTRSSVATLSIVQPAEAATQPTRSVAKSPVVALLAGALFGALIGVALASTIDQPRRRRVPLEPPGADALPNGLIEHGQPAAARRGSME